MMLDGAENMDVDQASDNTGHQTNNGQENAEFKEVLTQINRPMKKGEAWYLIESQWFDGFRKYAQTGGERPGPIDNKKILKNPDDGCPELRQQLQEHMDYVLVPEEVWEFLTERLGIVDVRQTIKRFVIEQGTHSSYTIVEVYPILLKCSEYVTSDKGIICKSFSRITTLGELEAEVRRLFNIPEDAETQLWSAGSVLNPFSDEPSSTVSIPPPPPPPPPPQPTSSSSPTPTINAGPRPAVIALPPPPSTTPTPSKMNDNQPLHEAGLTTGTIVTLEVKNADGTWPSSRPKMGRLSNVKAKTTPGLCGLINLGNTCFMNSALQCLSNVVPLTKYIQAGTHNQELNEENPLGMKGEIALRYAELITAIWSGEYPTVAPREFKATVGRFAPTFSGFNQQDSQELMAFLLDGLHEDLNRIKQKPYIEARGDQEAKRPDEEVAAESWSDYKKRNDSIVVDTFHGQLKSEITCPDCQLVSVTFDPFCYLSLPIPSRTQQRLNVTFMPLPIADPKHKTPDGLLPEFKIDRLLIPKSGSASEIATAVSERVNSSGKWPVKISPSELVVTHVSGHVFQKIYTPDEEYDLNQMQTTSVEAGCFVYQVRPNSLTLPLYFREQKFSSESYPALFGMPMILSLRDGSYETIYEAVSEQISRHASPYKIVPDNEEEMLTEVSENAKPSDENMSPDIAPSSALESTPLASTSKVEGTRTGTASSRSDSSDEGVAECDSSPINTLKEQFAQIALWLVNSAAKMDICKLEPPPPQNAWGTVHYSHPSITSSCYLAVDVFTELRAFFKHRFQWYKNTDAVHLISSDSSYGMDLSSISEKLDSTSAASSSTCSAIAASSSLNMSIHEAIKLYMQREKLSKDDQWYCPTCKDHKQAMKKFDIWKTPKILIFHLKRFSYSRYYRDKIDTLIDFPIKDLDMTEYLLGNSVSTDEFDGEKRHIYDLIAVSNHYGGLGGGHYTAYAKNDTTASWYHFDDSNVRPVSEGELITKAAYVLFYMRRD